MRIEALCARASSFDGSPSKEARSAASAAGKWWKTMSLDAMTPNAWTLPCGCSASDRVAIACARVTSLRSPVSRKRCKYSLASIRRVI